MVPESQDSIAVSFDHRCAVRIGFFIVLATIGFDDQLGTVTGDVREILAERNLLSKTEVRKGFTEQTP